MTSIDRRVVAILFLMVALAAGIAVPPAHADNNRVVFAAHGQPG